MDFDPILAWVSGLGWWGPIAAVGLGLLVRRLRSGATPAPPVPVTTPGVPVPVLAPAVAGGAIEAARRAARRLLGVPDPPPATTPDPVPPLIAAIAALAQTDRERLDRLIRPPT